MQKYNLARLKDLELLSKTKIIATKERQLTAAVLDHLQEIERRKLYSDLKYHSLFEYCVKELRYSEDQACKRINAMRTSTKIPAIKDKIDKGEISISNVNLLGGLFGKVKVTKEEQDKLIDDVAGKSKRECENALDSFKEVKGIEKSIKKPQVRNETAKTVRMSISLSKKTMEKIEQLKGAFAHQKDIDLAKIIDLMADSLLEKTEKKTKSKTIKNDNKKAAKRTRYIKAGVKAEVFNRAKNRCELCGSQHALQIDHHKPFAKGGNNSPENLRLICKNCNLREGIKIFGLEKMKRNLPIVRPGAD